MWMAVTFVTWSTRWMSFFFSFVDDDGVATTSSSLQPTIKTIPITLMSMKSNGVNREGSKKKERNRKKNRTWIWLNDSFNYRSCIDSAEVKAVAWFSFGLLRFDMYVMLMLYYREYHICIQSYWSSYRYCGTKKLLHSLICYNVYVRRSFFRDISHSELFSSLNIFTNQSMFTAAVLHFDHHTNIWTELLKFHDLISCFLCTY